MQSMRRAITILVTMLTAILATGSAVAGPGNLVYSFDSHYQEHASTGPDSFPQYNGPLQLIDVIVNWSGGASSSYSYPFSDPNAPIFPVSFSGGTGFIIYETGDGAFVPGSGVSNCTYLDCQVQLSGSGVAHFNPAGYIGSGSLTIDSQSFVDPRWDSFQSGGYSFFASGTITYVLGVPEPSNWAMMLIGFGVVGGALRLRQHKANLLVRTWDS